MWGSERSCPAAVCQPNRSKYVENPLERMYGVHVSSNHWPHCSICRKKSRPTYACMKEVVCTKSLLQINLPSDICKLHNCLVVT